MRIAYSAWGFVGEGVIDSPDGGRLTRALFIEHLIKKGHTVIWVQQNRDVDVKNVPLFSIDKTYTDDQKSTLCNLQYSMDYPDVDVLFIEWRWQIRGRNCYVDKSSDKYTPDLDRQNNLLQHYMSILKTRIVIWDKDEKMTYENEAQLIIKRPLRQDIILSPALFPESHVYKRQTLLFPCNLDKIKGTKLNDQLSLIGYVGSQYERDEQIYKYINPVSFIYPSGVEFAGNWMKYPETAKRNQYNFPAINFYDRLLPKDMGKIYSRCMTCVLLCKSNYAAHGHITQRIHEVASYGAIAIGLREQKGIEQFILQDNIISDAHDLIIRLKQLKEMTREEKQEILNQQIELLEPFDINNVMKEFERILNVSSI